MTMPQILDVPVLFLTFCADESSLYMLKIVNNDLVLPLLPCRIAAGFPSPADDWREDQIRLVDYLVRKPASTFVTQVTGVSMIGAGILDKDYLIVDKSITARSGQIVVACLNGELTVKRYSHANGIYALKAENPKFPDIVLSEENPPDLWGVVVGCVRRYG